MFEDRRARFRAFSAIEQIAEKARKFGEIENQINPNIATYIRNFLLRRSNIDLRLEIYEKSEHRVEAFVKARLGSSTVLNVRSDIWLSAEQNFAQPRFILAHELGHVLMHSHDSMAFSDIEPLNLSRIEREERTEPQANDFADLFLVPESMLKGLGSAEEIEYVFNVPWDCAKRRFEYIDDRRRRLRLGNQSGELCPQCANFTLARKGTCMKCDTCGSTTGCS